MHTTKRRLARLTTALLLAAGGGPVLAVATAAPAHASVPVDVCGWVSVNGITAPVPCLGECTIDQGPNEIQEGPVDVQSWECVVLP